MFDRVLNTPLDKKNHDQLIILTKTRKTFNPVSANPQNGQTHSNNSPTKADNLFESV